MRFRIIHLILPMLLPLSCVTEAATDNAQSIESVAIELAKKTLVTQEKININNIQVESTNAVQWPDSSLGCPKPGMMYGQMITAGYQITLRDSASKTLHTVHTGKDYAVICTSSGNTQLKTEKNLRFGKRWLLSQKAQKSLAKRLSIPKNAVRIVGTSTVPANSINCKNNATVDSQDLQIIKLSFNNTPYRYSVINNEVVFCD
ncbi:MAG: hypothetical protein COB30_004565 [Ectothiorhodospiraceae bacterium]|nr:hypothetical protein [Ectothiorhodospiraceae bacterium]